MNSFSFTLSGKHFICPSILNDSFVRWSNLEHRSLLFITLNTSCQSLLACKVSFEKSADSLMGTSQQVTLCFSVAAFKIISLSLSFGILTVTCLGVVLFVSILFGTLGFLDLYVYFLHQIREVFFHYFSQYVFNFLLFLFSWHPYDSDVGEFGNVLEVSYTILVVLVF